MRHKHRAVCAAATAVAILAAGTTAAAPAYAAKDRMNRPAKLAAGPKSVSEDVGDVAVIVDNGLLVTSRNLFDLSFPTTLRFEPAGAGKFAVSRAAGAFETALGPELTFGHPDATLYPGDDDSQAVDFPAGFPWFGTTWTSVFVNTDGNITLGAADFASTPRDKARHVLGPPRISAFLHDWNAKNALNPAGNGSIHAVSKSDPSRLVVTWNGVADFAGGVSNTFQIVLYSTGAVAITLTDIELASGTGIVGIAQGAGQGAIRNLDYSTQPSPQTLEAGAILEAFAPFTIVNRQQIAREFFRGHADDFDFVTIFSDFPVDGMYGSDVVSNQTHGIGMSINEFTGEWVLPSSVFDFSANYGSAGELEQLVWMQNVMLVPSDDPATIVNPPIEPYRTTSNTIRFEDQVGRAVTLDGQPMTKIRAAGSLPEDDGEMSRYFDRGGSYSFRIFDHMVLLCHEIEHRWAASLRFVHPTKGTGFDSYDLMGRQSAHWSFFLNTAVPAEQFADAPRSSVMEGNVIVDLGTPGTFRGAAVQLDAGERLFETPANALVDGFSALDQHLMGLRRAGDVGPFFYVDDPRSVIDGRSLDVFNPADVFDTTVTMRGWSPMGGIAFKGRRVDLTIKNIQDFEAMREGKENTKGVRFWGPKGNLKVRYWKGTGRVDPNGDASVTLSEADRELGDEADVIDAAGKPVDVKTIAFVLVVKDGSPSAHQTAIRRLDAMRRTFQDFANGPASGGRGRFDTVLHPATH